MNLKSILYLKPALSNLFIDIVNWSDFNLSPEEWRLIETAVKLLQPFKDTIKIFEAEKVPTMHRVIERIYTLNEILDEFAQLNRPTATFPFFAPVSFS